jgi:hypothetical protein
MEELDGVVGAELVAAVAADARGVVHALACRRLETDGGGGDGAALFADLASLAEGLDDPRARGAPIADPV